MKIYEILKIYENMKIILAKGPPLTGLRICSSEGLIATSIGVNSVVRSRLRAVGLGYRRLVCCRLCV